MRRHYRTIAFALSLGLAASVFAQDAGTNPSRRGALDRDPFGSGSLYGPSPRSDVGTSNFGQHQLRRGLAPRSNVPSVTPVPEPGQWAMMLAGLALVGWIVRRNTRR